MTTVRYNPETGMLTAPRESIQALMASATGSAMADVDAANAVLEVAGAGSLAEPHPALAPALSALRSPIVGLLLGKTGYAMPGVVGEGRAVLHAFRSGDDDQLVSLPAQQFVHFLLWLLDIGPRPEHERPPEITVDYATLHRAVALRLGDRPLDVTLPEPLHGALADGFRDWWMATSHWPAAPGSTGRVALEAIDTDQGLWQVQALADGSAVVRPARPSVAMIALGDLFPDADLVDQAAKRLPVEDTPTQGGPVDWVVEVLGEH